LVFLPWWERRRAPPWIGQVGVFLSSDMGAEYTGRRPRAGPFALGRPPLESKASALARGPGACLSGLPRHPESERPKALGAKLPTGAVERLSHWLPQSKQTARPGSMPKPQG